jgi:hypothetical protein
VQLEPELFDGRSQLASTSGPDVAMLLRERETRHYMGGQIPVASQHVSDHRTTSPPGVGVRVDRPLVVDPRVPARKALVAVLSMSHSESLRTTKIA